MEQSTFELFNVPCARTIEAYLRRNHLFEQRGFSYDLRTGTKNIVYHARGNDHQICALGVFLEQLRQPPYNEWEYALKSIVIEPAKHPYDPTLEALLVAQKSPPIQVLAVRERPVLLKTI